VTFSCAIPIESDCRSQRRILVYCLIDIASTIIFSPETEYVVTLFVLFASVT